MKKATVAVILGATMLTAPAALAIVPTGGGMAPLVLGHEVDFAYSGATHAQYTPTGEMLVAAFMSAERSPLFASTHRR